MFCIFTIHFFRRLTFMTTADGDKGRAIRDAFCLSDQVDFVSMAFEDLSLDVSSKRKRNSNVTL